MQWNEIDKTISKTFEFNSYLDGIDFVNEIANLAEQEKGDKMENDDKTEENVYPSTHWTIWVLGLISVAALIAFVMHLKI